METVFFVTGTPAVCQPGSAEKVSDAPRTLAPDVRQRDNRLMRALASVLVVALIVGGIYFFYVKRMPTAAEGTAPTQAISLTGVQSDLLQIAQAERAHIAQEGQCASLSGLVSSQSMTMSRTERDGYTYSVECSGTNFTVRAEHAPAPAGSPIRYPGFAIDQTMQVREAN